MCVCVGTCSKAQATVDLPLPDKPIIETVVIRKWSGVVTAEEVLGAIISAIITSDPDGAPLAPRQGLTLVLGEQTCKSW